MGIWEQMPPAFLDALGREFSFDPPRDHGVDAVDAVRRMRDGEITFFLALGGNFVAAMSDTAATEAAMDKLEMSVQISTKLNRSHTVVGEEALILPTLGRTEIDRQAAGVQFISVEDTMSAVHPSWGKVDPVGENLLSEVAIVARLAHAALGNTVDADWEGFEADYDRIRDHIANVVVGCEDYNVRIRQEGGFVMANGPRDSRTFNTPTGKAQLTVNALDRLECPPSRLILQTMRSHDQFNTTIYGYNDRYRGIKKGRHVVFANPEDIVELGLEDGQLVDVHGEYVDGKDRVLRRFRLVSYPTARGCAAVYYPEGNVLVPLDDTVKGSNTPVSKGVIVRLEPASEGPAGGSGEENAAADMPATV
jgi:molybdopterin-dependent oxidoreductase alpha subunit